MYADFHAFGREILRRYNDTLLRVIREEDPGRLVFTNRFLLGNMQSPVENLNLYERSGKPLLLGEWSVPARDSGLYNNPHRLDWSCPQTLATQQDRANQTTRVQADFYNLPFMLGAHFFIWRDFDSPVRQANRTIFRVSGEPWREMQDVLREINRRIQEAADIRDEREDGAG